MTIVLIVPCLLGYGQLFFERDLSVPATEQNDPLKYPWDGGLNNPQFAEPDLNNDGINDMVIFDRSGDHVLTFINNGTPNKIDYTFAPKYQKGFPEVRHWMLMGDYNCDGILDLFKSNPAKIDLWLGRYNARNELEFDSMFTLQYNSFSGFLDIFVTPGDLPAIADINGDGDLDVLKLNESPGLPRTAYYYENQSIEQTGGCDDTLNYFELYDECWGSFVETGVSLEVALDSCGIFKRSSNSQSRNGVNYSFMLYDEEGDGDKELFMGLSISQRINRMINGGTPDTAHIIAQDISFPSYDVSYSTQVFSVPSLLDINNDGLKDLVIGPHDVGRSENFTCAWYYQNVGNSDTSTFEMKTDTFINNESLDFGEGAHPAFFDYNADGLLDVVIGNYGYYSHGVNYRSVLALLENTGTATSPAFKLIDRNYLSLDSLGLAGINPAFGDMDADDDMDMIIGEADGYLYYFRNDGGAGNPASFTLAMPQMFGINVGQYSAPFIYDVNADSLPDLVVGERSGNINYFENTGAPTSPGFSMNPTNSLFGEIDVRVSPSITGYSTPVISRLDTTDQLYVLSGNEEGLLQVYEFNPANINSGSFKRISKAYSGIDEGERTSPAVADIDNDGKMEMLLGNYRGGVALFSQTDSIITGLDDQEAESLFEFKIIPNPASTKIMVTFSKHQTEKEIALSLFDLLGRERLNYQPVSLAGTITLNIADLPSGIYYLVVKSGNHSLTKPLIKSR